MIQTSPDRVHWVARRPGGPEVLQREVTALGAPESGEVIIDVRAVGMNPADWKHLQTASAKHGPSTIGFELAGVLRELGPDTQIASGVAHPGDPVVAFQLSDSYTTAVRVRGSDVFAKPQALNFAEAANLLLVGTTAAELLAAVQVQRDDVVLVHGAAGGVGFSAAQQALQRGARVIGTSSPRDFDQLREAGVEAIDYAPGLAQRVRDAGARVDVALDTVGAEEAVKASLALVADRRRIVTTAAFQQARESGFRFVGAGNPASGAFRAHARADVLRMADAGRLRVPLAATYPFERAPEALAALRAPHASGKFALTVPD